MIFNLMKPVPTTESATMYLYGHEADKTVTYNGVELPELPVWDKVSYPYAFISYNTAGFYSLYCFSTEPSVAYKSNQTLVPYSENGYYIGAIFQENEWGEFGEPKEFVGLLGSVTKGIIWANFDLRYQGTEDVHFEASEPVTTYENADVTINGVGYVGTILPSLPNYDKETYPYAMLSQLGGFYVSSNKITYGGVGIKSMKVTAPYMQTTIGNDGHFRGWEQHDTGTSVFGKPTWSNHDILNEDGTVYFSASNEPLPVSLPIIMYDGEIALEQPEWMDNASGNISLECGYKVGDTLEITLDGHTEIYTATMADTFTYVIVGNNGLNGNDTEGVDDGGDILLAVPQLVEGLWSSYIYTRTPGTHQVTIKLIGVK